MRILTLLFTTAALLLAEGATVEQLFNVTTVKVVKKKAAFFHRYYALFKADENRVADVAPRFSGYVVRLRADTLYRRIAKGEALTTVYALDVYKAKEVYRNALRYAKARNG